jgi:hypothetical protein
MVKRPASELRHNAVELLRRHLRRRPIDNPIRRFASRFEDELPHLQAAGLPEYHAWAFATTRQLGASMELLAAHLQWLAAGTDAGFDGPAKSFSQVSEAAKTFILKAARAVNTKKPMDTASMFDEMALNWERGVSALDAHLTNPHAHA